jgi:sarcosine oxidase delta subunit
MKRLLPLFALLALLACSSGKQALQKGNYEESVLKAINRLRSNPGHSKARETLKQAYALTQQYHLERIATLKASAEAFRWESILTSYNTLTSLHNEIQRCPACLQVTANSRSYLNEANQARYEAAAERYQTGKTVFARDNSRQSAKEAYLHFRCTMELVPDYQDVRQRMDEAFYYATLKIVLEQIPAHSRSMGLSHEFFQNKINEFVSSARMNDFVRFYTPQEAHAAKVKQPDHVIKLQFDDFVVGQVYLKESTEKLSRDSVIVGQVEVEGVKKNVYGTVTAELTTFKKMVSSKGLLDLQIYDPLAQRVINQQKMPGEFVWASEWANFKGDERALTKDQIARCKLKEVPPPLPQDLFLEFCKPIYGQVTSHLERFYRSY